MCSLNIKMFWFPHMEPQGISNSQTILKRKNKVGGLTQFLTSKYMTNLQKLKQCGTGIKADM